MFSTQGTELMFSLAWHRSHLFPHVTPVAPVFPRLALLHILVFYLVCFVICQGVCYIRIAARGDNIDLGFTAIIEKTVDYFLLF